MTHCASDLTIFDLNFGVISLLMLAKCSTELDYSPNI